MSIVAQFFRVRCDDDLRYWAWYNMPAWLPAQFHLSVGDSPRGRGEEEETVFFTRRGAGLHYFVSHVRYSPPREAIESFRDCVRHGVATRIRAFSGTVHETTQ